MAKPKYKSKAKTYDMSLEPFAPLFVEHMETLGWTAIEMSKRTTRGDSDLPFECFHRKIENPVKSEQKSSVIFSQGGLGEKTDFLENSVSTEISTVTAPEKLGGEIPMGKPKVALPPSEVSSGSNYVSVNGNFDQVPTIRNMRSDADSFVIGFDTEFFYEDDDQRRIICYQFTFVHPDTPNFIDELIVFSTDNETLSLSVMVSFIIEHWSIDRYFGDCLGGIQFSRARRWDVPVVNKNGDHVLRRFDSFDKAVVACVDLEYQAALKKVGPRSRCLFDFVDSGNGVIQRVPREEVNGYGLGYVLDYSVFNKNAIPVTIVSHYGSADLTALNVDGEYEKDLMTRVSNVQGGLVSLEDYYIHPPKLSAYWSFYPVKMTIRDTMCFAPAGSKKLEDLGKTLGVPKLEVSPPYDKSDMLTYFRERLDEFCDYAVNDAVITLVYSGALWGYNKEMPVTITSASVRAAIPVIKEALGLSQDDNAGFDREFRGLVRNKKGLSMVKGEKAAYIENTALEPISDDARIVQEVARQSYKGGFNGCFKPGYYEHETYDFDLCNAYPTAMALVPDIDWDNPIAFEGKNQVLTKSMLPNPCVPFFAYATFEFPETVRFPCGPVSVEGSLIYPRTSGDLNGAYVAGPELFLALQLGATVHLKRYYSCNLKMINGQVSRSLDRVVKRMIQDRNVVKSMFRGNDTLQLFIKTATNGLYGKTAQDVIDKHSWSARTETMENIGGSRMTSPVHASMITSIVRAVLLAALNQIVELGYNVYSVTTDGFISDVPEDVLNSLDFYGFAPLFRACRMDLTGSDGMWEMKHHNSHLLNVTTRGNCSLDVEDKDKGKLGGVMAHNSFVTGEIPDSYEDRECFMFLTMTREGRLKTTSVSFENFKNMAKRDGRVDFTSGKQDRLLSMDFDLKRKPIQETMEDSYRYFPDYYNVEFNEIGEVLDFTKFQRDDVGWVASFDTVPYESPEEFIYYKNLGKSCSVLRTVDDWNLFFDKVEAKKDGVRRNIKDLEWSKLVSCVMSYRLGVPLDEFDGPVRIPFMDDSNHSVAEKVDWINTFNKSKKKFTENTWKDCRKQTRASQILSESLFIDLLKDMVHWGEDSESEED